MATKHRLTTRTDHIDGFSGRDVFLAPALHGKASLTNKDVLNGGGGIDTITAKLFGTTMAPHLAQIEKGVFTRLSTKDLTLDLAHATAMRNVTLKNFDADVTINHAGKLSTLTLNNSDDHSYHVKGINTTKIGTEKLIFTNNASEVSVDFQNRDNLSFKALDVVVKNSHVLLTGDVAASTVALHAGGTNNTVDLQADMAAAGNVKTVKIDGAGNLDFRGMTLTGLVTFDASKATGDISASINSTSLTKVLGGKGDDTVDLSAIVYDPAKHFIDGGEGVDTVVVKGALPVFGGITQNFEKLSVKEATGIYDLATSAIIGMEVQAAAVTTVLNAGKLSSFALANTINQTVVVGGLDNATLGTLAFKEVTGSTVDLKTIDGSNLKALDISLDGSAIKLNGDVAAASLTIHSNGTATNKLDVIPDTDTSAIKTIVIDGDADLNTSESGVKFTSLTSFDASAAKGTVTAIIGGTSLAEVLGGAGSDSLYLQGLAATKAVIDLGAGNDILNMGPVMLDSNFHSIDGGNGTDKVTLSGALTNANLLLKSIEELTVYNGSGAYNLAGTGVKYVDIYNQSASIVVSDMVDGGRVDLNDSTDFATSVFVTDAAGSTSDKLNLNLYGGEFGTNSAGFNADDLSNLTIFSTATANTLSLGELGTDSQNGTNITITGDQALTLNSTIGTRFISSITINTIISNNTINGDVGVNLLDLADQNGVLGSHSFVDTGATIKGGIGNDKLVGGVGNDVISTGDGNNFVHSSLGEDTINFQGGSDIFVVDSLAHVSGEKNVDTINNYGSLDGIDISAMAQSFVWKGNVGSLSDGLDLIENGSGTQVFFATDIDTLCIDINQDGMIQTIDDIIIILKDLDSFSQAGLLV